MNELGRYLSLWTPQVLSILRIMSGLLLLQHGTVKWLSFPSGSPMSGTGSLSSLSGVAGIIELIAGFLLVIGLFSRASAFVLSGLMAAAYFIAHQPQGFFPILNGGELAVLYCFVFFFIVFAGPGCWSVDALLRAGQVQSDRDLRFGRTQS